jgi:putative endonuclease
MAQHNRKGQQAEALACKHLQAQGLNLVARNFNVRQGEIDLIMREGETTVFVEVRYRRRSTFGSGAESIDRNKQRRLIQAAARYLQQHPKLAKHPSRFDVVAISNDGDAPDIQWIKNAFMAE